MARARKQGRGKRVVVLMGSPRREGNTAALATRVAGGAADAGARVETFYLHGLTIRPCTACEACHKPKAKGCRLRDDMDRLYPALRAADAIVFASPIYWFTVSAQMKLAVDRCYALLGPKGHALAGKRMGLVFTYGGEDPFDSGCTNAIRMFQDAFGFIGAPIAGMVYASSGAGPVRDNAKALDEAADLGRKLVAAS